MADLNLKGVLNLTGVLKLAGAGGKVTVDGKEVLLVDAGVAHGTGVPVIIPSPPASPTDPGTDAYIFKSLNTTVTVDNKNIVTTGLHLQGDVPTWPGMVLASTVNPTVSIHNVEINVVGDQGVTTANSGTVNYHTSGQ